MGKRRLLAVSAAVLALAGSLAGAPAAGSAAPAGGASPDGAYCGILSDRPGGVSMDLHVCDTAWGSSSARFQVLYLDRADYGPNPTSWAGQLALHANATVTGSASNPATRWWRMCGHNDGGPYLCTRWFDGLHF